MGQDLLNGRALSCRNNPRKAGVIMDSSANLPATAVLVPDGVNNARFTQREIRTRLLSLSSSSSLLRKDIILNELRTKYLRERTMLVYIQRGSTTIHSSKIFLRYKHVMLYIRFKYKHYKFVININTIDTSLRFLF